MADTTIASASIRPAGRLPAAGRALDHLFAALPALWLLGVFIVPLGFTVVFSFGHSSFGGIKLGFDSYSIRAFKWKALELIDYAAGFQLDTIQLSSLGDYESLEPAYLKQAKERDPKQREAMLDQIQQMTIDRAMFAPIMDLRALMGVGPRIKNHLIGEVWMSAFPSYEDMELKD